MGTLKLKRLLGSKKPLRGILDALTRVHSGVFWIESPEGKVLFGEAVEGGAVHELMHEDVVVGRLCSQGTADEVLHIVRGFIQLEAEKRDITSEVLERYRELSLLYELAERLTRCDNVHSIAEVVLQEAQKVAPTDWGFLWLGDSVPSSFIAEVGEPIQGRACPLLDSVNESGQAAIIEDAGESEAIRSWVAAPVRGRAGILGVLVLGARSPETYDSGTLKLVNSLAGQVAPAIESARLTERQRELARSFARFVPEEFLGALERSNVAEIGPGQGAEKVMSVLFSDIRAFTTLVEGKTPEESYAFINEYLSHIEPGVRDNSGFLGEVIGDAIVALFSDGGADNAVRAAIQCERALIAYNQTRKAAGELQVDMGMGITTGAIMLGTIGAPERIKCSVIGDAVNTAARIEGLTKIYGAKILLSDLTLAQLKDPSAYLMRPVDKVRAVGKKKPITIYEILDTLPEEQLERRLKAQKDFETGWTLYQEGEPGDALVAFASALRVDPKDPLTRLFLGRCWQFLEYGMPSDWDGVTEMRTK